MLATSHKMDAHSTLFGGITSDVITSECNPRQVLPSQYVCMHANTSPVPPLNRTMRLV